MQVTTYLGVDQIWSMGIKGQGIVIGIVDSGINAVGRTQQKMGETGIINNVIGGWPPQRLGNNFSPTGHGNMTATDALGMAPGAQPYDIRISSPDLSIPAVVSNAYAGLGWAINQHKNNGTPHILSNRLGNVSKSFGYRLCYKSRASYTESY